MAFDPPAQKNCRTVEDPAWLRALQIATSSGVPAAAKALLNLNIFNILADQDRQAPGTQLSAAEIVSRMQLNPSHKPSPTVIDRMLRLLASHDVVSSSPQSLDTSSEHAQAAATRAYGLNSVSRYFVGDASLATVLKMNQDPVLLKAWQHIEESVLDGGEPFVKAHGIDVFAHAERDARLNELFHRAMTENTMLLMPYFIETYTGFDDSIRSLVDVGGGLGSCLGMITSKYLHIHGINYDLPYIVAAAPSYPNVEHVGGDMFESVPKADAIILKWILHDWSDEQCIAILKNCYEALPSQGKVIVLGIVLPNGVGHELKARVGYQLDLCMFAFMDGGRERTKDEIEALAKEVGFSSVDLVCEIQDNSVLEIHK